MIASIFKNLNWVDVIVSLTVIWILFTGIKDGFVKSLLHLIGTFFSLFISFHYYSGFSGFFVKKIPLSASLVDVVVFLLLWFLSFIAFRFLEKGIFFIFTIEVHNIVDKWGSAVLALIRSAVIGSIFLFILLLSHNAYLQQQALSSFSRKGLLDFAPKVYLSLFKDVIHPLFPEEHQNTHVSAVLKGESSSRKGIKRKIDRQKEPEKLNYEKDR